MNFSHAKRSRNRVADAVAHLQPFSTSLREWVGDGPDPVSNLALDDICMDSTQ